jgi:hypothetical protein
MNDRSYDTPEYKAKLNADKRERRVRMASFFDTYDLGLNNYHEVYVKDDKGGMMKVGECRGTRAMQVNLRREVRAKMDLGAERVMLFTNGIRVKTGINKKA